MCIIDERVARVALEGDPEFIQVHYKVVWHDDPGHWDWIPAEDVEDGALVSDWLRRRNGRRARVPAEKPRWLLGITPPAPPPHYELCEGSRAIALGRLRYARALTALMPTEADAARALSYLFPTETTTRAQVTGRINVSKDLAPALFNCFRHAAALGLLCAWYVLPPAADENDFLWEWCYRFMKNEQAARLDVADHDLTAEQGEILSTLDFGFVAVPPGCVQWRALRDSEDTLPIDATNELRGPELERRLVLAVVLKPSSGARSASSGRRGGLEPPRTGRRTRASDS